MAITAFPPIDEIGALGRSPYEQDFLRREFEPGLSYYTSRLDRLMLAGHRLLDAGCGAGQWAIAATQRFDHVDAIDVDAPRLSVANQIASRMGVSNLHLQQGSIEALPYPDATFDAVICYGVIMFTDVARGIGEFHRVLKPGGRAYVCLNGDGWSHYLVHERGPAEPKVRDIGWQTLYNSYWRRAVAKGMPLQLKMAADQLQALNAKMAQVNRPDGQSGLTPARYIAERALLSSATGQELVGLVNAHCGPDQAGQLVDDAARVIETQLPPVPTLRSQAYLPEELDALCGQAGFSEFCWSTEAGLTADWLLPPPSPRYRGYYNGFLSVWEAQFVKPDTAVKVPVDPARHFLAALSHREERLLLEPSERTVVTNASRATYPLEYLHRAKRMGELLGGGAYLKALAQELTKDSASEEDAFKRVLVFVQRSMFRDPVSQPLTKTGGIPDPLTVLLSGRGRCSHTTSVLLALCDCLGLAVRSTQLVHHVIAEVKVNDRWVIADADAFKNGIVLVNRAGELLSFDDLLTDPYQIDRFQPTGWWVRAGSRFSRGATDRAVVGYVDALDPDQRGFVSGFYLESACGYPPSLPEITRVERRNGRVQVSWLPSTIRDLSSIHYRVMLGSQSRGWSYDRPGDRDEILTAPLSDLGKFETTEPFLECADTGAGRIFVSVTAVSDRVRLEPETYFWPSEEVVSAE